MVANKTDLCSAEPTPVPQIQYGVAIPHAADDESPAATTAEAAAAAAKLRPRAVSTIEGALFAKEHNLLYVETSAKEGWGVVDAFEWTARQILERVERGEFERRKPSGVKLDSAKTKGGCC